MTSDADVWLKAAIPAGTVRKKATARAESGGSKRGETETRLGFRGRILRDLRRAREPG
ncbi:hypothetical protein LNKW23_16670 [Paralimibaculum aggregatum]|uniref:Uncharacterized protein n=1 Tax=Paralimibaculum aggregatum TaxID=3036245 RepID=A0ABQ6LP88_9RHOB|nr:hypothetical protein [Limibaculum sp. NKW23]GMG82454.1 hypothetical protein LNKW23_16670 [Limibaculum sp. NKW23]